MVRTVEKQASRHGRFCARTARSGAARKLQLVGNRPGYRVLQRDPGMRDPPVGHPEAADYGVSSTGKRKNRTSTPHDQWHAIEGRR